MTFDYRIRRPLDGTVRWLRNTDFPLVGADGQVRLIGGVGHDMTALRETERRLQLLLEGIPQLVWRADGRGNWTWCSPQWRTYTGQAEEVAKALGWLSAFHPDDRDAVLRAWGVAQTRGHLQIEARIKRAGGSVYRWFQTRALPVRDASGSIVEWLGTSTDVDEMRALQERQQVLVAELQHRTRNLIAVVRAMAEKSAKSSADLLTFRTRFGHQLSALSRIQGLLSRLNEHDRVPFDQLLNAELVAVDADAERVTLDGPKGVRLRSSSVQILALALHELATNSVKYGALGQHHAKLIISWSLEANGNEPRLHIDWRESGVDMQSIRRKVQSGGQGRELIEQALPYQLNAVTSFELRSDGVHCKIAIPVSASTAETEARDG